MLIHSQGAHEPVDVDTVRLGAPGAAIDWQAGGVEHVVLDVVSDEEAVQPEAIVSRLLTAEDPNRSAECGLETAAGLDNQREQGSGIAARNRIVADPAVGQRALGISRGLS
ncbi:hypothetical protein [Azospirillum brasilense]|uniref:hypothetical protein n=1 Tax=Azospirillum brasilense TaxID=192 RepID=UPI001EDC697E|nr:hypothetical protein [Azospirillum brasilense]UKJ75400.1 hypothetical protein H1Q64_14160 [Azospirillum brasilense]